MPAPNSNFVDEARAAARGVFALVMGDRGASRHFLFTEAGLVSSFIAVLIVTGIQLVLTAAVGSGSMLASLVQSVIIYGATLGASALYLRQIGRWDALVPFVVTVNWSNAILSMIMLVTVMLGLGFLVLVFLIVGIVLSINIARLVMTLKPVQIVLLILAQAVGLILALILIVLLFPPTPEQLAEIAAASSAR